MKLNPPPGYTGPMDPHLSLYADPETRGQDNRQWTCRDCGAAGDLSELMYGPGCTAAQANCTDCGYGPVCAKDCFGAAKALDDPALVVRWHEPDAAPVPELGDLDYRAWALDLCALLDAIEQAIRKGQQERALTLTRGRFEMAEKHGLTFHSISGQASGETH